MSKEKTVPAATIQGTYSTYEDSKQRSFNEQLGNVVDFKLENMVMIELGSWMSGLKLYADKGVKVSVEQLPDGRTRIFLSKR